MKLIYRYTSEKVKDIKSGVIKACLKKGGNKISVLLLTSSPRSGSTWLSNALRTIPKSCVLFEPLNLTNVPEARAAGFTWRTYIDPAIAWPKGHAFLTRVFEGKVINRWTTKEMSIIDACSCETMIVKFVRANRLLPWICYNFDIPPPIVLLRHPCAVIASQLRYEYWRNIKHPEIPPYIDHYPVFKDVVSEAREPEEFLAVLWALDQLPLFVSESPSRWIFVTYEELFQRPEEPLSRIFQSWNIDIDIGVPLSRMRKPSSVVSKYGISGMSGWQHYLSSSQVANILSITKKFGLDFYSEQVEPDYGKLFRPTLPKLIEKYGIF